MKPVCIMLCAGRGTRMKDDRTHKVCYELAGRPAVLRLVDNLRTAGIERFITVVGCKADKVMDCLSEVPGVVFAYQKVQNGTGSAALIGLETMLSMGLEGPAVIVMGDKIISPSVFEALENAYTEDRHAVFAIQPKEFNPSGGRVLIRNGKFFGIVEKADSCRMKLSEYLPDCAVHAEEVFEGYSVNETKRAGILSSLDGLNEPIKRVFCGESFCADDIESGEYVNTATYMVDARRCAENLRSLDSANAQGEIYMTDAINSFAEQGRAYPTIVGDKTDILTYSTMEELLRLEKYFALPVSRPVFPTASEYIAAIENSSQEINDYFTAQYGDNAELISERKKAYIDILHAFISEYGDRSSVLARAPGRVNLMGRHIEHRGGSINVMSINREMLVVAATREDDTVCIRNTDHDFSGQEFAIAKYLGNCDAGNWVEFIESDAICELVSNNKGDWGNYVKAALLRLQLFDKSLPLCGMDMIFSGNIPMAAGLSSSSSIVVATAEAALALNGHELKTSDFITLCGEGEWFVGSRGGAGDHAAMKCGRTGEITHMTFFPFGIGDRVKFSDKYCLIVANSFVSAKKSEGSRDTFNSRVAAYEFGLMLLQERFPEYRDRMRVLRDVNPTTLSVPPSRIYEMLLELPESMSEKEIRDALESKHGDAIARIFKTHAPQASYPIRSVVLYGIAECERAERCIDILRASDYNKLGELMNISHNGDRVVNNNSVYEGGAGRARLLGLMNDLRSENTKKVEAAQLYNQPGGYGCSTEKIDALVDYVLTLDGVLGAQLSGAGLGGCIMILAERTKEQYILDSIRQNYYEPEGLEMGAQAFVPTGGSGVFPAFGCLLPQEK